MAVATATLIAAGIAASQVGAAAISAKASRDSAKTLAEAEGQNLEAQERAQRYKAEMLRQNAPNLSQRFAGYQALGDKGLSGLGLTPPQRTPANLGGPSDADLDRFFPTTAGPSQGYMNRRGPQGQQGPPRPPQIGETKTFPNQRVGRWDGQGWVAVR